MAKRSVIASVAKRSGLFPALVLAVTLALSAPAFADCTSPSSPAGGLQYFSGDDYKYCDGTNWIDWGAGAGAAAAGVDGAIQFNNNSAFAGASTFVYKSATGRVGIGTASPSDLLDIASGSSQFIFKPNGTEPYMQVTNGTISSINGHVSSTDGAVYGAISNHATTFRAGGNIGRFRISNSGGFAFGNTYYSTNPGANNMIVEGNVGIGVNAPSAMLQVNAASAGAKAVIVRGAASQTANFQEWQDSTGTPFLTINNLGHLIGNQNNLAMSSNSHEFTARHTSGAIIFSMNSFNPATKGARFNSTMALGWSSFAGGMDASPTTAWYSPTRGKIEQRNGTDPQTYEVYGTYTSSTDHEGLRFKATSAGDSEIANFVGSAGGTLRGLAIGGYSAGASTITPWMNFTSAGYVGIGDTTPDSGSGGQLTLDVAGAVGATKYCDDSGNNCFTAASVGGGGASAGGNNNTIQFNNSSALAGASTFVYNSANGYVGIGTASPLYPVDIRASTGATLLHLGADGDYGLYLGTNTSSQSGAYMSGGATMNAAGNAWIAKATSATLFGAYGGDVRIFNNTGLTPGNSYTPTERFVILSSGVVGINETNPGAMLQVNAVNSGAKGAIFKGAASQSARLTEWQDNSAAALAFVSSSGQVHAPKYCDVSGGNCFNAASVGGGGTAAGSEGSIQYNNSNAFAGTSTFVYTSAGRLGLGTASPGYTLDVAGQGRFKTDNTDLSAVVIADSAGTTALKIFAGGAADATYPSIRSASNSLLFNPGTGGATYIGNQVSGNFVVNSSLIYGDASNGWVGINTASPRGSLDVNGNLFLNNNGQIQITSSPNSTGLQLIGSAGVSSLVGTMDATPLLLRTASTERMRISSTGTVGINTNLPSAMLHVNAASAAAKGIVVQGAASQTANLQEWQNSSGTALATVNQTGNIGIGMTAPTTAALGNLSIGTTGAGSPYSNIDFVYTPSSSLYTNSIQNSFSGTPTIHRMDFVIKQLGTSNTSLQLFGDKSAVFNANLSVNSASAGVKGLIVKGAASQSANLQEWQSSAGTALAFVSSSGQVHAPRYCDVSGGVCFNAASVGGSGAAPGLNKQVLFNDSGAFNAASGFVFSSATGHVAIGTDTPAFRLDVRDTTVPAHIMDMTLNTANSNTETALRLGRPGQSAVSWSSYADFAIGRYEAVSTYARTQLDIKLSNNAVAAPEATIMSLRSNGNVGIGTTAPAELLNLNGNGVNLKFSGTTNNAGTHGVVFAHATAPSSNSVTGMFGVPTGASSLGKLVFSVGSSASSAVNATTDGKMTISSSGVSITDSYSNNVFLTVGPGQAINTGDRGVLIDFSTGAPSSGLIAKAYGSFGDTDYIGLALDNSATPDSADAGLILKSSGAVGIGTVNPSSSLKLDVEGAVGASQYCDESGTNCFTAASVGSGGGGSAAAAGVDGAIQFNNNSAFAGASTFVYKSATGRVGIGTATPSATLTLDSSAGGQQTYINALDTDSGSGSAFRLDVDSNANSWLYLSQNGTDVIRLSTWDNAYINKATAIGATSVQGSGMLSVTGGDFVMNGAAAAGHRYRVNIVDSVGSTVSDNWGYLRFSTTSGAGTPVERMRITSGGLVGIGSESPGALLHMNLTSAGASTKGVIVQGAASQTANLQEWQSSAGTVLAYTTPSGMFYSNTRFTAGTSTAGAYMDFGGGGNSGYIAWQRGGTRLAYMGYDAGNNVTTTLEAGGTFALKGAASQSARLTEWQNDSGTALAFVSSSGQVHAPRYCDVSGGVCFNAASVGSGGGTAAGSEGSIQYNNSNAFTGSSYFTYTSAGRLTLLKGTFNTFIDAGNENASGTYNVAIGNTALYGLTSGASNVAIGGTSLYSVGAGSYNVGVGLQSLYYTTGAGNVGMGHAAMFANQGGNNNVAIGYEAGRGVNGVTVTSANVFLGYRAGYGISTGGNNVMIGYQAGDSATTGTGNIVLGYDADLPAAASSNRLNIGNTIYGDLSNKLVGINVSSAAATLQVNAASAGAKGIVVQGFSAQTADLIRAENSAGTLLFAVSSSGNLRMNTSTASGTNSVAFGNNTFARGAYSAAFGQYSEANGSHSMAMGTGLNGSGSTPMASGTGSFAGGYVVDYGYVRATNNGSFAFGFTPGSGYILASGEGSFVHGYGDNGNSIIASGAGSTAWGYGNSGAPITASGTGSTAWGGGAVAGGNYSTAFGNYVTAGDGTGDTAAVAFGYETKAIGTRTIAISTGDSSTTTYPQVSGTGSIGIFMGNQASVDLTATNIMSIMGGRVGIGTVSPASAGSQILTLDVEGPVGATAYCDSNGSNCFNAASVGAIETVTGQPAPVSMNLDDLGDVDAASPSTNDVLTWDGSDWTAQASGGGGVAEGPNRAIQYNNSSAFAGSSTFVYNATSGFVGIGTASPTASLVIGTSIPGGSGMPSNVKLGVMGSPTSTSGAEGAISAQVYATPGATSTAMSYGVFGEATTTSGQTFSTTPALVGIGGRVWHRGPNSVSGAAFYAATPGNTGGGGFSNAYGFYMASQSGYYGIYSAGTTDRNIFAGSMRVGATTDPSVALDVTGDIEYTGTITDVSDMRLKTDIMPLDKDAVIDRLNKIETYSFRMKDDPKGQIEFGVMAQELEKVFPELVKTADDEMGTKSVNYVGLIAPLIEASKDLKAENDAMKSDLEQMKDDIAQLKINNMREAGFGITGMLALSLLMSVLGSSIFLVLRRKGHE